MDRRFWLRYYGNSYEQALRLPPKQPAHAATWHDKGVALGHLGRHAEALAALAQALLYYEDALARQRRLVEPTRPWQVVRELARTLRGKGGTLQDCQRWQEAAACYAEAVECWEHLVQAGMLHLAPDLLQGLRQCFRMHQHVAAWDAAASVVLHVYTAVTPFLHAPAPATRLRDEYARFRTLLQELAGKELIRVHEALGPQALRLQESLGLPPDPRKVALPSMPHPGANIDRAVALNAQYFQQLAQWQALPWWQRLRQPKPTRPQGI